MPSHSIQELANQAEVSPEYVLRLIELGALEPTDSDAANGSSESGRVRLLHAWEEAGLSAEDIMDLVRAGELSISWLDTPAITKAVRLELTFEQLCSEEQMPLTIVQSLYEAIGLAPPGPDEPSVQVTVNWWICCRCSSQQGPGRDQHFDCSGSMQTACAGSPWPRQSCTSPRSRNRNGAQGGVSAS